MNRGHFTQQPEPQSSTHHEVLTVTEAADVLRVPVATLRYWRHLGTGPRSFKIGRHVAYRTVDLETWIEQQVARSDGDPT